MRRVIGVAAVIGLAVGLTWAAEQVGGWLGFVRQDRTDAAQEQSRGESEAPGIKGVAPGNDGVPSSNEDSGDEGELSAEVTSIEEDLARIEDALGSDEVLEEFTPSEPLSADNPVVWPTDI